MGNEQLDLTPHPGDVPLGTISKVIVPWKRVIEKHDKGVIEELLTPGNTVMIYPVAVQVWEQKE